MTGGVHLGYSFKGNKQQQQLFQIDKSFITNIVFICYD